MSVEKQGGSQHVTMAMANYDLSSPQKLLSVVAHGDKRPDGLKEKKRKNSPVRRPLKPLLYSLSFVMPKKWSERKLEMTAD